MSLFAKTFDTACVFVIGVGIGVGLVMFALTHHPVISDIIQSEGGDITSRFAVVCAPLTNAQVKCFKEKELVDAN